jgi:uncharacterized protein
MIGVIGMSAAVAGVLQWLSIVSGIFIILFAWRGYYRFTPKLGGFNAWISRQLGGQFKKQKERKSYRRLLGIGVLNAYLPCGMVYVAMLSALNTGSIQHAAIFMFFFGLGTLPGFLGLAFVKNKVTHSRFFQNKVLVASMLTLVGMLIIVRGMNLGIPMISPKMEITETLVGEGHTESEVTMSCCSKNASDSACEEK